MRRGVAKDYLKGSRRHHRGHASYPLDRFLTSRLGRSWDKVFSEMAEAFDSRTLAGHDFFRDLRWQVQTNCWIGADTGRVFNGHGLVSGEFYVHPFTGLLCYAPPTKFERPDYPQTKIKLSEDVYFEKEDGIWFSHQITRRWTEKDIYGREFERTVTTKTQLGKKDLRSRGLENGPFPYHNRCTTCGFMGRCVHVIRTEDRKASWWR